MCTTIFYASKRFCADLYMYACKICVYMQRTTFTPTKPYIFTKLSGSCKKTFCMLNHCVCVQNYVCVLNYFVRTQNIWCVYEIVLYA